MLVDERDDYSLIYTTEATNQVMRLLKNPSWNLDKQLTYRPDIDGLRAIAVLSVVVYHAWPTALPGGFIGVDIFFVISGYLISGIIFKETKQGAFSFKNFYARRIRRIFPALILVLFSFLVMGWFALLPNEYQVMGKHIASSVVFISNFTLIRESGYFDTHTELKPLLHLWSLGIEEQFYIIWPLLIFTATKLRINLLSTIVALAVLSFGLNIIRLDTRLVQTFYHPLTRFWELLLGAALAHLSLYSNQEAYKHFQQKFGNLITLVGLALLVSALTLLNKNRSFPGWWALLPTLGTVSFIAAGPDTWASKKLLTWRPIVFIGLIIGLLKKREKNRSKS